jgi:hypothetical protein
MTARMVNAITKTIRRANTNLVGFGFGAMVSLLVPVPLLVPVLIGEICELLHTSLACPKNATRRGSGRVNLVRRYAGQSRQVFFTMLWGERSTTRGLVKRARAEFVSGANAITNSGAR